MKADAKRKPKHLDLFSGIGGFSLAFESEGFETVGFVECDERKRIVLRHWWPAIRIFDDVRDTDGIRAFCESIGGIDVLTGGVPCQPASALGQMRGTADERWLWPETIRLVCAVRPRYAVFENPPSLLVLEEGRAWNGIVSELVVGRFDCWWDVFPAAAFGSGHLRERVLLVVADAQRPPRSIERRGERGERGERCQSIQHDVSCGQGSIAADADNLNRRSGAGGKNGTEVNNNGLQSVAHTHRTGLEGYARHEDVRSANGGGYEESGRPIAAPDLRGRVFATTAGEPAWWHEAHTGIPVLAHGLPAKLVEAAARCTGDAVVPKVVQPIARAIRKMMETKEANE